ncbi:MAG: MATE family efflux transporter, partial [Ilumatobacteraceae bacterium]
GAADYRTPLVILLSSNLVNLVLELLFVFVFEWGVAGSAWSTVIAQAGAGIAFVVVIRRHLAPAVERRPSRAGMAPLLTAGRHLLLRVGSMLAVLSGATAIAARVDEPTLAAHQIAASILLFLALALDALAIPAQTLVADELGRESIPAAAAVSGRVAWLSIVAGGILAVVVGVAAPLLPHAFTGDDAVADRATAALVWLAIMLVPAAIAFAYDGVLIGAGDYRFLGWAALAYLAAVTPLGLLVLPTGAGIGGIWSALALWMVLRAVVNHLRATRLLSTDRPSSLPTPAL